MASRTDLFKNYKWYKLDNAATIVPATAKGSDTRVFRLTCQLKEKVDGDILQSALDLTLEEFPHFNVVLRKGFFWYYLDSTNMRAEVTEEDRPACESIYYPGKRNLLYRVNYFENRINLEMFHVLADGTGAFVFMKKLVMNYLSEYHGIPIQGEADVASSAQEKNEDAFDQYYSKSRRSGQLGEMMGTKAYQIRQDKDDNMQNHLVEGTVSASGFVEIAHRYKTTAGILTVALFIESILESMSVKDQKKVIVVSVPVNLRQFFPSETTRNFFGVLNVSFHPGDYDGSLSSIIAVTREAFESQLSEDSIRSNMNSYSALQHNIAVKMIPLFLKDLGLWFITARTRYGTTATLSNIGRIVMPEEFAPYIDRFSAFMSTQNMQITVASFRDRMVFGAVSGYPEHNVLVRLFRKLSALGLKVEIGTNDYDRREES